MTRRIERGDRTRNVVSAVAVFALIGLATAGSASATTILDTHGFEPPLFTTSFGGTGQLEGQPTTIPAEIWLKSLDPGTSTAVVENTVFFGGSQAVQLNRGANSNIRWGVPLSGLPANPTDLITI